MPGHIELERATDSIWCGRRHREDFGDLDRLVKSIHREGMLQPITISPDGMLICGARRLNAIRQLGWKTVNVWVRSGISTPLGQLLAEQDDNLLHKPLTAIEEATLYRELKTVMAEDATRRQVASRFTPNGENPRSDGGAESAPPWNETGGKTREQAAFMVTGKASYSRLEEINRLQTIADDPTQPETVRQVAAGELASITAGAPVHPALQRVSAHQALTELDTLAADPAQPAGIRDSATAGAARVRELEGTARAADLERLAQAALERAKAATIRKGTAPVGSHLRAVSEEPVLLPVRSFIYLWDDMATWATRYDPATIGPALTLEQWDQFEATLTATITFADAARTARTARTASSGQRATA
jgi:ParB family chromosome partitioning protein